MESKPVEELKQALEAVKVNDEEQRPFEPCLDLRDALVEMRINWKSPEFTEEDMKKKF
jgi:hypothetical protein